MPNDIAYTKNYTSIIDEVYQRASVSHVLNSGRRMVRAGRNAREIMIPKITVSGLGNYVRNEGYKTGSINYEFETKTFNYAIGIKLFADVIPIRRGNSAEMCAFAIPVIIKLVEALCDQSYYFKLKPRSTNSLC